MSVQDWVGLWRHGTDGKETAPPLAPFPEPETQKTTNNVARRHTMEAAGEFYRLLTEEIPADRDDLTILDYGAGWDASPDSCCARSRPRTSPPSV